VLGAPVEYSALMVLIQPTEENYSSIKARTYKVMRYSSHPQVFSFSSGKGKERQMEKSCRIQIA
jgi:hypothetical protein